MNSLQKGQQVNKSGRRDARGIAQLMRPGVFNPVHLETLTALGVHAVLLLRN
jgi:hypothetical protein